MLTRRGFIKGLGRLILAGILTGTYAVAGEPFRLRVQRYRPRLAAWPDDLPLRIAVLTDIHACEPWMNVARLRYLVGRTNRLRPDLTVLLGDYTTGHRWTTAQVHSKDWAPVLGGLRAPLGVHAILGNHDWWEDRSAQRNGHGPTFGHRALSAAGLNVLENDAVRIDHQGQAFWLAGLGDQLAFAPGWGGRRGWSGADDLPGTLAQISDDAPAILLVHEPDIFPQVPARIALTLAGHTHGGQVRLFGHSPVVPSRFGNRYAYGHVREPRGDGETSLVVSGGLGCSIAPVRLGVPPEIVLVELGKPSNQDV